ncbi:MAG: cytochrome c [Hyphomonadaceae bacterium]|nr:cytochrome c [Hyphomonadaceae bacterium]
MRFALALLIVAFLAACASHEPLRAPTERGRTLAQQHCSSCHAIGPTGESNAPEAPPFRTLSANYRVDTLEAALAEGISVGHPAMPQFEFAPEDVDALVAYLQSIQSPALD